MVPQCLGHGNKARTRTPTACSANTSPEARTFARHTAEEFEAVAPTLQQQTTQDRVELASAIHNYIEIWHNTRRRRSALNMLTPSEYENHHHQQEIAA